MASSYDFAELGARSSYTFLRGASHPEEIFERAAALGYHSIAVVDRGGMYGTPRAHVAAKRQSAVRFLVGTEIPIDQGAEDEFPWLLAEDRNGYGNLCEMCTDAHRQGIDAFAATPAPRSRKGTVTAEERAARLPWERLLERNSGTICLLPIEALGNAPLVPLREAFGDRLFLSVTPRYDGTDTARFSSADQAEKQHGIPVVFSQRSPFHDAGRKPLHDLLAAIHFRCRLDQLGKRAIPNGEVALQAAEKLYRRFPTAHRWLARTVAVAERCHFSLSELRYHYPSEWLPAGETAQSYLEKLAREGIHFRYPTGAPPQVETMLCHELKLIEELSYADFFLTVWDIVAFARKQNILCQGRGSSANSIVCYLLGVTAIDPAKLDLLFERFLSKERNEPPDIDVDFEHERREEVIQYIYQRYGRDRAAISAEVLCFRKKSALRESAKAFGLSETFVKKIHVHAHRRSLSEIDDAELVEVFHSTATKEDKPQDALSLRGWFSLAEQLRGFPRHLGTHVGGFVLTNDKLIRSVPVQPTAMEGRTIVQWDKYDLDSLGIIRVDVLGLGMLTALRKSFDYVQTVYGRKLTLATLPQEDAVYSRISRGDTLGVFQIESRAQMNMLPRLRPREFYDLVIEVAIVRPGPIQGNMVHPYLRRRLGLEKVEYAHPALEKILKRTLGIPLFQEQILKMAMAVAGFTGGEADELRRALGAWRRDGGERLGALNARFRSGLLANGVPVDFADRILSQIQGFAEYGFPESHAASFAVLVYASAYVRHYYPDAFVVGLLNSQPMGFYGPDSLIYDAMRRRVQVEGVCVQTSQWDTQHVGPSRVLLGFREVRGMRRPFAEAIEAARKTGPFESVRDFVERVRRTLREHKQLRPARRDVLQLAQANAFRSFAKGRRETMWDLYGIDLEEPEFSATEDAATPLPDEAGWEKIVLDYEAQGVALAGHPMGYLRPRLHARGIHCSQSIRFVREGTRVTVAGVVICRQMPETASGVVFFTLEDEAGFLNLVVWPQVFDQFREVFLGETLLHCHGRLQRSDKGRALDRDANGEKEVPVLQILVESAQTLTLDEPGELSVPSHDFH